MAHAVNTVKDATGVSASLVSAGNQTSGLVLNTTEYGSDAFVSVKKLDDGDFFQTFNAQGGSAVSRDTGEDVLARSTAASRSATAWTSRYAATRSASR